MRKRFHFRRPFDKQHGKHTQALFKSPSHHRYHIHWSLPSYFTLKKFLLLTCQILGLLLDILAADENYPLLNRENLTIPIQMQLSEKRKTFCKFLAGFLKYSLKFKYFEKKIPSSLYLRNYRLGKCTHINLWNVLFQRTLRQAAW